MDTQIATLLLLCLASVEFSFAIEVAAGETNAEPNLDTLEAGPRFDVVPPDVWTAELIDSELKLPNLIPLSAFSGQKQIHTYFSRRYIGKFKYNPFIDLAIQRTWPLDLKDKRINVFRDFMNSNFTHDLVFNKQQILNHIGCGELFEAVMKLALLNIKLDYTYFLAIEYLIDYVEYNVPICGFLVDPDYRSIIKEAFDLEEINKDVSARSALGYLIKTLVRDFDFIKYYNQYQYNYETVGDVLTNLLQHIETVGDTAQKDASRILQRYVKQSGLNYIGYIEGKSPFSP